MPAGVVIHPGFHKTGTTTIQKTLRANRALLSPELRIVLRPGMVALCEAARAYSATGRALDLGLVRYEAASLAEGWMARAGTVLLSSEDLCGHMPGRRGLRDYRAAPTLLAAITDSFTAALGAVPIHVVLTTRTAAPWLRSCYVQHLRATRIVLNEQEYCDRYAGSARLDLIVEAIARSLPAHDVQAAPLEASASDPLGPVTPVLDAARVPQDLRALLTTMPPANVAPSQDQIDTLLALNRSDLSAADLRVAKRAVGRGAA